MIGLLERIYIVVLGVSPTHCEARPPRPLPALAPTTTCRIVMTIFIKQKQPSVNKEHWDTHNDKNNQSWHFVKYYILIVMVHLPKFVIISVGVFLICYGNIYFTKILPNIPRGMYATFALQHC